MTQTANNYGTVLYELGVAGEVVAETERIFSLTPELSKSLGSPIVSAKEKHKLIDSIFPQEVRNFLKVLCDNGSVGELADIFSSYHTCYDAHNGILRATLSYVTPPTESQLAQMKEHLKKEYPEFHVLPMESYEGFCPGIPEVTEEKDEELKKTVRIFPHKMKGEGHYVALLQKGEPLPAKELKTKKKAGKIPADLEEFMKQVTWKLDGSRLDIHGERIYYMPEGLPDVRGIRFLRTGLLLGELKKNRFEPSQAFAMCLKKDEYAQIIDLPCEDERVRRYLKGETLDVDDLTERKAKGWYLVCVDGFPLGWGKVSNGTLKNKYLPGWRLC